jgi:hypothetical protein
MPFKSDQQRKACFATDGFGGKVDCKAWAEKSKGKKLPHKVKSFKEWLEEFDPEKLSQAQQDAMDTTGTPGYAKANLARKAELKQKELVEPLTREEYIDLYGYVAWTDYVEKHGLPEDHPMADQS